MVFLHLVAYTVGSVDTTLGKRPLAVLDVVHKKDILSGVIANFTLVLKDMKLSTVGFARIFHVTCL